MKKLCIICEKQPISDTYKPFCCKRCADIDLYHWTTERYTLPAEDVEYADSIPSDSDAIN